MWEDNAKMDLREIGLGGIHWVVLAGDRAKWRVNVNKAMNLRVP
jgi:hypothetical protein